MNAFKKYGWAIKIIGAALLLALALFLEFGNGEGIVIPFIGGSIILYSVVRLIPFVKTQKNDLIKTINIIEITVDIGIGLVLIIVEMFTTATLGIWFGYLLGFYLMLRGIVHFYGVSLVAEKSDVVLFLFHISALIVGSYIFFFDGGFTAGILIHIILAFSIAAGGYLVFDGYKGYNVYRRQKTLTMPDTVKPEESVGDKPAVVIEEEEPVQDQIVS